MVVVVDVGERHFADHFLSRHCRGRKDVLAVPHERFGDVSDCASLVIRRFGKGECFETCCVGVPESAFTVAYLGAQRPRPDFVNTGL